MPAVKSTGRSKKTSTKKVSVPTTYIGIVRDHSGSMGHLTNGAMKDYNQMIEDLKTSSAKEKQNSIVTVSKCDSSIPAGSEIETRMTNVNFVSPISHYHACGGTPLFRCIGEIIEQFKRVPDFNDPKVAFLIMAITDGEDNASGDWQRRLPQEIRTLQGTDRWTFTFRVPRGYANTLVRLGVHSGNIFEWDQTEEGFAVATAAAFSGITDYMGSRSIGHTHTKSFYARTDMTGVKPSTVSAKLQNISSEVQFLLVCQSDDGAEIRDFCERKLGRPMIKGAAFYQLTKSEKVVQDYKVIAIRNKKNNEVYSGVQARSLLGLPHNGNVKIIPGNHGQYDIFIQSTSVNRKLVAGTHLMYWENSSVI